MKPKDVMVFCPQSIEDKPLCGNRAYFKGTVLAEGSNIPEAEIYIGRIQMLTEIRPKFAVSGISRLSRGRKSFVNMQSVVTQNFDIEKESSGAKGIIWNHGKKCKQGS